MTRPEDIKLLATDLDGTLLDSDMCVSPENREALERCAEAGICVVIATGRTRSSLPQAVLDMDCVSYYVCANGAKIYDAHCGEQIYAKCLSVEAVESVMDVISNPAVMVELFWEGQPYVDAECYKDPTRFGVPHWVCNYITDTRVPVRSIVEFAREHMGDIENINFNYANDELRNWIYSRLFGSGLYTLTSSMAYNFEIGGAGVSKAAALEFLCERIGISREETLCIGDNNNDLEMLRFAGIAVAAAGATAIVKAAADVCTLDHNDSGVAFAINNLLFP
jgi:Cof subfamily protein (haloacid dehalogenase superfamily)